MLIRISFFSVLFGSCLLTSAQAVTVSFQNGFGGYTGQQSVGWNGNHTTTAGPPSASLPGHAPYAAGSIHGGTGYIDRIYQTGFGRSYTQVIRFDDIFGSGPGQIPNNPQYTVIDSATLTYNLVNGVAGQDPSDTWVYRAHRVLVDWSQGDLGVNFGPRDNALGKPQGPDLVTPGELTSTYINSFPTSNLVTTFDLTSDLQYFLENSSERYGWAFGLDSALSGGQTSGGPIYLSQAHGALVPLLEVSFTVLPIPEPSSFLLMGLGILGMVRYTRKRNQRRS